MSSNKNSCKRIRSYFGFNNPISIAAMNGSLAKAIIVALTQLIDQTDLFDVLAFLDVTNVCVNCKNNGGGLCRECESNLYFVCWCAVGMSPCHLQEVPREFRTRALIWHALQSFGTSLCYVPYYQLTQAMCWTAVLNEGMALSMVPPHFVTKSMCFAAVKQNAWAFTWVPARFKSYALCLFVMKENPEFLYIIPKRWKSYRICFHAVKSHPAVLKYAPKKYRQLLKKSLTPPYNSS